MHVAELGDWVRVDQHAAKPLFDQLRTQIIDGIRDGTLPPGTRLPTVRELAGQMGLAVNTVARAYRELETAGILETRMRADPRQSFFLHPAQRRNTLAHRLGLPDLQIGVCRGAGDGIGGVGTGVEKRVPAILGIMRLENLRACQSGGQR